MEIFGRQVVIDLIFLIFCLGTVYSAVSKGVIPELFKTIGLLAGTFLAFQYYPFLSTVLCEKILILNQRLLNFISFFIIFFGIKLIFSFLRLILAALIKREHIPLGERWALCFTGLARGVLFLSVMFFLASLSSLPQQRLYRSLFYKVSKNAAPKFYIISFELYKKFNPYISFNKEVREYEAKKTLY
ncbi:MAG: CvpA family protein [Candidatus Omnitrophota bacterium]